MISQRQYKYKLFLEMIDISSEGSFEKCKTAITEKQKLAETSVVCGPINKLYLGKLHQLGFSVKPILEESYQMETQTFVAWGKSKFQSDIRDPHNHNT
jgi:hypothetical protein